MFATLTSVALWNGTGSRLASCPIQENLYFGIRDVRGLTDELAVTSSGGLLPDPETCGSNCLEDVIADLKYTGNFTRQDMSQIIRAGYGCTPHTTYNGRGGLTVASWCAEYYLAGNIYVVDHDGVFRYHNRSPGSDITTRDNRIERIRTGDVRDGLRSGICLMRRVLLYCVWMLRMWISGMRALSRGLLQGICCCRGRCWV